MFHDRRFIAFIACSLALSLMMACAPTATITKMDGSTVEAEIIGSSSGTIEVKSEDEESESVDIKRSEISTINHPGDIHMIAGGVTLAGGIGMMVPGFLLFAEEADQNVGDNCTINTCERGDNAQETTSIVLITVGTATAMAGIGVLLWGMNAYLTSTGNAEFEEGDLSFQATPWASVDPDGSTTGGASLSIVW